MLSNNSYDSEVNSTLDACGNFSTSGIVGKPTSAFTKLGSSVAIDSIYRFFQVGINAGDSNQISVSTTYALNGLDSLRGIGISKSDYLSQLDDMLNEVSVKLTEFGAVSNRLESVLDEITIRYDNLVSSRSTLRDADIAEVSASYVQQQILLQASATLLSTANQTPAIALQLI